MTTLARIEKKPDVGLDVPGAFRGLYRNHRYKVFYGGRGSSKSWTIARVLLSLAYTSKVRVLCVREFQTSIADSVHKLLSDQIEALGLGSFFAITKNSILCPLTGSEFLFKGLRRNINEIKSTEGIDICWAEEAQSVSAESWQILIPTIRKEYSEIWVTFNPDDSESSTWKRFVINPPKNALVVKVNFDGNPWFPEVLNDERLDMLAKDPDAYDWVWNGNCRTISDAVIFKGRYIVDDFSEPEDVRPYYGVDWGFSQDPTVMVRCYIQDNTLYVTHEAYGRGVEFEQLPGFFDSVPKSREWPVKADNARPETISYVRRQGFNIAPADKWPGSIEDGIAHLKGFTKIVIHPRCKHFTMEAALYKYKVDQNTGDVLPVIVDANNHLWDALRYALDGYIRRSSTVGVFAKLGAMA